ncbi:MAG: hypothetical protein L0228_17440 [Planctomycetes bacterium]|nr:hypothetical protein [Planctomycetota bacterium]
MNRFSVQRAFVLAALIAVSGAGCERRSSDAGTTAAAPTATQLTPEESFKLLVETFRRGIEDVPVGFVVQDGSGSQTMMTGRNEVSHELLPPAKDGDPYKAVIIVKSQSRYSLQRSEKPDDAANSDQESDNESFDPASDDGSGVQVFDSDLVSAPGADRRTTSKKVDRNAVAVAQKVEEHERPYELVYENGRWKLVTKLDPKTEGSIKLAFDRALDSQS